MVKTKDMAISLLALAGALGGWVYGSLKVPDACSFLAICGFFAGIAVFVVTDFILGMLMGVGEFLANSFSRSKR